MVKPVTLLRSGPWKVLFPIGAGITAVHGESYCAAVRREAPSRGTRESVKKEDVFVIVWRSQGQGLGVGGVERGSVRLARVDRHPLAGGTFAPDADRLESFAHKRAVGRRERREGTCAKCIERNEVLRMQKHRGGRRQAEVSQFCLLGVPTQYSSSLRLRRTSAGMIVAIATTRAYGARSRGVVSSTRSYMRGTSRIFHARAFVMFTSG